MVTLDLDKIASELGTLFVPVTQDDATDYKKLQKKIISCNLNQDTVTRHLTVVEPILSRKENEINNKKFELKTRKHDIKTNVKEVKSCPTAKERDEAAEEILSADYKELLKMENARNDLLVVKNSLLITLRKLKTTEQNIKLLKSMLDEQVSKLNLGSTDDPDVAHLQKSLAELDGLCDDLEDEVGLEEDVESSEEYTKEDYSIEIDAENEEKDSSEGATHDTTNAEPSNEPLDSQDSHEASESILLDIVDGDGESRSDASEGPSNEPLDPEESRAETTEPEDSSEEDDSGSSFIENLLNETVEDSLTGEDDYDIDSQDNEEVTEKQPVSNDDEESPEPEKRKRTPMEEILNEDFTEEDDQPVGKEVKMEVVDDSEIDISSFMDDLDIESTEETDVEEESVVEDLVEENLVEEAVEKVDKPVEKVESKKLNVVEDDASIGVEYDIESLLDM